MVNRIKVTTRSCSFLQVQMAISDMILSQTASISSKLLPDLRMENEILSEEKLSFVSLHDAVTINRYFALVIL